MRHASDLQEQLTIEEERKRHADEEATMKLIAELEKKDEEAVHRLREDRLKQEEDAMHCPVCFEEYDE